MTHPDPIMLPHEHVKARKALGLTVEQLAYELGVNALTIRRRECGVSMIKREAKLALERLLDNPPTPVHIPAPRVRAAGGCAFRVGDKFGLFTITEVHRGRGERWRPVMLGVRCDCGRERLLQAVNFHPGFTCGPACPAHAAMVERGSHVDANGDILDIDGFPES